MFENLRHKIKWYLVQCMPWWVIEFSILRAMCYATSGKYSDTFTGELTAIELLKRWEAQ